MYYAEINERIKKKFDAKEKVTELRVLPKLSEIKQVPDNLIKVPFITMSVEIVNFDLLYKFTDPITWNLVCSEFVNGVGKIIQTFGAHDIHPQVGGIVANFVGSTKSDVDNAFVCACAINAFKKHLNKLVERFFPGDIQKAKSSTGLGHKTNLEFGIGLWLSFDNFISKAIPAFGNGLLYMGQSVNMAQYLSRLSSQNGKSNILMNDLFDNNFTNEKKELLQNKGGFSSFVDEHLKQKVYQCDWTIRNYDQFIDNDV